MPIVKNDRSHPVNFTFGTYGGALPKRAEIKVRNVECAELALVQWMSLDICWAGDEPQRHTINVTFSGSTYGSGNCFRCCRAMFG